MAVLGVDGCPGGWVAARVRGHGVTGAAAEKDCAEGTARVTWHAGSFAELLAVDAVAVGVDIPIGLPDAGVRRAADVAARQRLGAQRSSVFFTPPRVVLEAGSQPEATALSRAAGSTGVSIQMFHILGRVAEVDLLLRQDERAAQRVVEVHPELSFRELARGRPLPPKKTPAGRAARLELLRSWLPGFALPGRLPGRARPDDCLDAAAAAWTADRWARGEAEVLGQEHDGAGQPMRIVV